jgi:hypothetical protein
VGKLKRPAELKDASRSGFDGAQNLDALILPVELPAQNGRNDNDNESIGEVGHSGKPLF